MRATTDKDLLLARIAVSTVFFVDGAALGGLAPHYPAIKEALHLSASELGISLLFASGGAVLAMPLIGRLVHRVGSVSVCLGSGLATCTALALTGFVPNVALFRFALLLVGIFQGALDMSMNANAVALQGSFPKPIISSVHGWFSVGGFAGGAGVWLAVRFGVTTGSHLLIASLVLAAILLWATSRLIDSEASESGGPSFALPKGLLVLVGLLMMFSFASEGAVWDWSAVYLRTVLKSTDAIAAIGFGMFSFGMAFGRLAGDHVVHRIGAVRTVQIGGFGSAAGMFISVAIPEPSVAMIGFTFMGLGIANIVPILFRVAGNVPGVPPAIGIATVTTCGYGAFLLAPPVIGTVADHVGLGAALAGAGVLILIVAIFGGYAVKATHVS